MRLLRRQVLSELSEWFICNTVCPLSHHLHERDHIPTSTQDKLIYVNLLLKDKVSERQNLEVTYNLCATVVILSVYRRWNGALPYCNGPKQFLNFKEKLFQRHKSLHYDCVIYITNDTTNKNDEKSLVVKFNLRLYQIHNDIKFLCIDHLYYYCQKIGI